MLPFYHKLFFVLKKATPQLGKHRYIAEFLSCIVAATSIFLFVSLFSYSPKDPSSISFRFPASSIENLGGIVGSYIAGYLVYTLGIAAFAVPIALLGYTKQLWKKNTLGISISQTLGWTALTMSVSMSLSSIWHHITLYSVPVLAGGWIGEEAYLQLTHLLGYFGCILVIILGYLSSILLIVKKSFTSIFDFKFPRREKTQEPPTPQKVGADMIPEVKWTDKEVDRETKIETAIPKGPPPVVSNLEMEGEYTPPPSDIFRTTAISEKMTESQRREFQNTAQKLTEAFLEFNIQGQVIAIQPGPVVAVYEFQPEAGIKLSKMTGLIDDIALALKVDSIFIHPVSGKRALGVQVPNRSRETVFLGDIVAGESFRNATSPLTFAMGKDLSGDPISEDLAKMPHLLVAGQTGSGKSVAINSLLCSIILKAKPQDVKMVLVDPKILELKIYEGIPHLLMPVITEAEKASLALKWACFEMDRRYKLMEQAKVRHISGFNDYWESANEDEKKNFQTMCEQEIESKLPYIVVVIDELADLMLTAPKDVESSIQRLAQKARASGIHLVLATQRPSVDVITGVIKANLPCRVSFKVFSRGDSRTILDSIGAERLLGKGDMLFLKPGSSRLQRMQGAFLEDKEVLDMVNAIKSHDGAHYNETAISWIEEEFAKSSGQQDSEESVLDDDPKWDLALAIAQKQGAVSASYLQRSLKIGYNRAARIVETMESQGLVGKADGSKPRKWLGPT